MTGRAALLSGGTGFVGGSLATALRTAGWDVHAITRPTSDAGAVGRLREVGCAVHLHDGSLDRLAGIVREAKPACTWHLATHFIGDHAPDDVAPLVRNNVEFGALLLEALRREPAPAVVTAGSLWQQHDNAAYAPLSLYASTKEAFDAIATYYAQVRGFRIVELLLTDTYGRADRRRKLLAQLFDAARSGVPLPMSGEGTQFIDLLHVDDAVRALQVAGDRAVAAAPGTSERWAVRPGRALRVRELVERVGVAVGRPVAVAWGARPSRPREMTTPWTAGATLPGWAAQVGLDAGLRDLA